MRTVGISPYRALYSRSLDRHHSRGTLWFTPHSHGLRPDAYYRGHQRAAQDALELADDKWGKIFGEIFPAAQDRLAGWLGSARPRDIAFAGSTHELVTRVLSNYSGVARAPGEPIRILTSDQEFHSATRQLKRLAELPSVQVDVVPLTPFETFTERVKQSVRQNHPQVALLSHVFFQSGRVLPDLAGLVQSLSVYCERVIIDGYHAVGAFPVDELLPEVIDKVYYVGGGYKYLMAGEGMCYMSLPKGCQDRPVNTGWMAHFESLATGVTAPVPYSEGGMRYAGATFDPAAFYRFLAIWQALDEAAIDIATIHQHVIGLQTYFLEQLDAKPETPLRRSQLAHALTEPRANFLCFHTDQAQAVHDRLKERNIRTDYRGDFLRIGFGLYHDEMDVDQLVSALS
jgi:kynureninase